MKLKDAIFEMKSGDWFEPKENCFCEVELNKAGVAVNTSDKTPINLSLTNLNIEGEIIPSEPKVLTAEESLNQYEGQVIDAGDYISGFEDGMENGRLERDLEYKQALSELWENVSMMSDYYFEDTFKNLLKPLNKQDA